MWSVWWWRCGFVTALWGSSTCTNLPLSFLFHLYKHTAHGGTAATVTTLVWSIKNIYLNGTCCCSKSRFASPTWSAPALRTLCEANSGCPALSCCDGTWLNLTRQRSLLAVVEHWQPTPPNVYLLFWMSYMLGNFQLNTREDCQCNRLQWMWTKCLLLKQAESEKYKDTAAS